MLGPFGHKKRALLAHLKMFKIHLENFAEINLEISLNFFAEILLDNLAEICLTVLEDIHFKKIAEIR